MYKAKILKVFDNNTYLINIPALNLQINEVYAVVGKGLYPKYEIGDLVIAAETEDEAWVILGYVYGQV